MIEWFLLVLALSFDTFLVSVTYGLNDIKYSRYSTLIISGIGSLFLMLSLLLAQFFQAFLTESMSLMISVSLLLGLGFLSLFQSIMKAMLAHLRKQPFCLKVKNLKLLLEIAEDEKKADVDASKTLSNAETYLLGIALSFDSLASGFAYGLSIQPSIMMILLNFACGCFFVQLGSWLGRKMKHRCPINLAWLSGLFLILLAISRLR